jgi:CspA family cold shock protein
MKGNVKWFNKHTGYGFITSEDNRNVYAHYSQILTNKYQELDDNEEVVFDISDGKFGLEALKIKRVIEYQ